MAEAPLRDDCQQGPSEISSHSEGEYNVKNIQDLLSQLLVAASKIKESQPPVEGIQSGLRQSAEDSDWDRHLWMGNCKALLGLLKVNPCLVVQTRSDGFTVLHAAARGGCKELAYYVYDNLFKETGKFVDEQSGINITWEEFVDAKQSGAREARAVDYALHSDPSTLFNFLRTGTDRSHWASRLRQQIRSSSAPSQVKSEDVEEVKSHDVEDVKSHDAEDVKSHDAEDVKSHDAEVKSHDDKAVKSGDERQKLPFHNAAERKCLGLCSASNHLLEIMQEESTKELFKGFSKGYEEETFEFELKELQFHHVAGLMSNPWANAEKYVEDVMTKCINLGEPRSANVLTYLFKLQNMAGETPLHCALAEWGPNSLETLMNLIPKKDDYEECFNAVDAKGWTTLHHAAATRKHKSLELLLKYEWVDVNTRTNEYQGGRTALHLAILHDDVKSVELLLNCPRTDVNALLSKKIIYGYRRLKNSYWSPLQLAAIMGLSSIVRIFLEPKQFPEIFDDGKISNGSALPHKNFQRISAVLLASASGNPETLRLFLDNRQFNPLVKFEGATTLHYASDVRLPYSTTKSFTTRRPILLDNGQVNFFLDYCRDFAGVSSKFKFEKMELSEINLKAMSTSYLANQACITMLLQAGVDIWDKDDNDRFAEPGLGATEEARLWWYNRIAQETFEAKKSLNDAANAISVVAALVATASFVGPLQPPLGYGQDTNLSVRVFMVSNNFSFYLAIASIMFAVSPSLPMPQEGIYAEWQRTRRAVGMAIFFLLMSVLGVLISFSAASNSIVSEEYSWRHSGFSFYPALMGGLLCMISISLFFLRLLRLVFNKNEKIRWLYKCFVKF